MLFLATLTFVAGLSCINANIWRVLRQEEPEIVIENATHTYERPHQKCFDAMESCSVNHHESPYQIDQNGISFSTDTIDILCSNGDVYFPCIEDEMPDEEICANITAMVQQWKKIYEFVCITNRADMYDFLHCANNKLLQLNVNGCINKFGGGKRMLRMLRIRGVVITSQIKHDLLCRIMDYLKWCILSDIRSYCEESYDATGSKLVDMSIEAMGFDMGDDLIDFPSCLGDLKYH